MPVSSKMSSGRKPERMSFGKMGASWYHIPARLRRRRKDIWSSSLRKPCGSVSRYSDGGRKGANAALGSFSEPGLGGASYPPGSWPGPPVPVRGSKPDLPPGFDGDGMPLTMPASYLSSPGRMSPPPPSPKRPGWPRVGGMLDS